MNVLRPRAETDKARWKRTQSRKPLKELEQNWKRISALGFTSRHNSAVNKSLYRLDYTGRPFATLLHLLQISDRHWPGSQLCRQQICGRHCVLQGEVDADAPGGRHRMCTVADTQQAFAIPFSQAVDLDGEQFDLCPIIQLHDSIFQERSEANDVAVQGRQAALLDRIELTFWDNKT